MGRGRPRLYNDPVHLAATASTLRWRKANPVAYRIGAIRARVKKKKKALALIGPPVCATCGVDDPRVLEINHVDGGGHKEWMERILNGKPGSMVDAMLKGFRDAKGLNILCRPCNSADHLERQYPDLKGRCTVKWSHSPTSLDSLIDPWLAAGFPPREDPLKAKGLL